MTVDRRRWCLLLMPAAFTAVGMLLTDEMLTAFPSRKSPVLVYANEAEAVYEIR